MARPRTLIFLLAIFAVVVMAGSAPVAAGPVKGPVPPLAWSSVGFEGNWYVEWQVAQKDNSDDSSIRTTYAALTLSHGWHQVCVYLKNGACLWEERPTQPVTWKAAGYYGYDPAKHGYDRIYYYAKSIDANPGGTLTVQHDDGLLGQWGGRSTLYQEGRDLLRDNWKYKNHAYGTGFWRRAIPQISHVVIVTGNVPSASSLKSDVPAGRAGLAEFTYDAGYWDVSNDILGSRPEIDISVYGKDLWGAHLVEFRGDPGFRILSWGPIYDNKYSGVDHVTGLKVKMYLLASSRPGQKVLYLDGIPIRFNLVVKGYPEDQPRHYFRIGELSIVKSGHAEHAGAHGGAKQNKPFPAMVSSEDYRATRVGGKEKTIAELNDALRRARVNLFEAEAMRARAAAELPGLTAEVQSARQELWDSNATSMVIQALAQAGVQVTSATAKLLKGNLAGMLNDAVNDVVWNILTPPTIYDVTAPQTSRVDRHSVSALGLYPAKQIVRTVSKPASAGRVARAMGSGLAAEKKFAERRWEKTLQKLLTLPDSESARKLIKTEISQHRYLRSLERVLKKFKIARDESPVGPYLRRKVAKGFVAGIAKAYATDTVKRAIARYMTAPAVKDYISDQALLSQTIRTLGGARKLVDKAKRQMSVAEAARDKLLNEYDPKSGFEVEKNDLFSPKAGYAFNLYPQTGKAKPGAPVQPVPHVFLQGVELAEQPSPDGLKYVIRAADEKRFDAPLPDALTLTIREQ